MASSTSLWPQQATLSGSAEVNASRIDTRRHSSSSKSILSRKTSNPSKFWKQPVSIRQELCFGMKPPPCIVSLRKKKRDLRRKRRKPYTAILVGAFLMRLEAQAVKTRPKKKPIEMDRIKKGSRLEAFMTKLTTIAKCRKPINSVLVPIQPWRSKSTTSSIPTSSTSSLSNSSSYHHPKPPPPPVASRTVKSELCPVTETCTAATMPPSSPSSSRQKNKMTASHQKTIMSHHRTETVTISSTPDGSRKSICSSPKPIMPTIARIKTDPSNANYPHHTSTSLISPDLQRVRVDIGHSPLLPHHRHLLPTIPHMQSMPHHPKLDSSSVPYRDSSPFISPRKRMMLEHETNGSPSKKHRLSTDSGGSGGSSEGVRSGVDSPLLNQHQRVGSPAGGLSYGTSPPRLPQGAAVQAKSSVSSFSIDSIMSSRSSQDEKDGILNSTKSNPIRPVAIPASPMRVSGINRDHDREEVLHRSRSTSESPPQTPIQPFQRRTPSGVSPPSTMNPSLLVPITPYQNRGMDPNIPIDPRLAHLAGLTANPTLGLTPTGGAPFPYSPAIGSVPQINPYYAYQIAAAASAGLWIPPSATPVTSAITMSSLDSAQNTTSSSFNITTPNRSSPSLIQGQSLISSSQRGVSSNFSPWGPQMSYRGEPRVSTSSSNAVSSRTVSDLDKPDSISSGKLCFFILRMRIMRLS